MVRSEIRAYDTLGAHPRVDRRHYLDDGDAPMTVYIAGPYSIRYHTNEDCRQLDTHAENVVERELEEVEHMGLCAVCDGTVGASHTEAHERRNMLLDLDPDEVFG